MAGRGTDILLGGNAEMLARYEVHAGREPTSCAHDHEALDAGDQGRDRALQGRPARPRSKEVLGAGGLHILGTERHESRRIDNQLRGRGGRQGDPGSSRFYLSLEDDLMRIFAGERIQVLMDRLGMEEDIPIEHKWVTKAVENAQTKVEQRNFDIRKNLLEYDDVMNQQRKSIYALRRQVLSGQYRREPTKDERERGVVPEPLVAQADPRYVEMMASRAREPGQAAAAAPPPRRRDAGGAGGLAQGRARRRRSTTLKQIGYRAARAGAVRQLRLQDRPARASRPIRRAASSTSSEVVPLSLTEQRERLLDLVDEVDRHDGRARLPAEKHFEDWDLDGLEQGLSRRCSASRRPASRSSPTQQEIAREAVRRRRGGAARSASSEVGELLYLRVFRNFFLQEIDNQWLEHLQNMESLRDGIGLRGYGQRDPKKEYQKEGFDLFLELMQNDQGSVVQKMFHFVIEREDEVERLEAERRRRVEARQQRMSASHAARPRPLPQPPRRASRRRRRRRRARRAGGAARVAARAPAHGRDWVSSRRAAAGAAKPQTVKRDKPKVGRNDPCWCGSGKKYKNCHLRSDEEAQANVEP